MSNENYPANAFSLSYYSQYSRRLYEHSEYIRKKFQLIQKKFILSDDAIDKAIDLYQDISAVEIFRGALRAAIMAACLITNCDSSELSKINLRINEFVNHFNVTNRQLESAIYKVPELKKSLPKKIMVSQKITTTLDPISDSRLVVTSRIPCRRTVKPREHHT